MATSDEEIRLLISIPGIPSKIRDTRRSYQRKLAVYFILASTLCERIAFYSLVANLVLVLKSSQFKWNSRNSATALYSFAGTSYISTLLFAGISDAKLGRAKTIVIGFILYLIGYIMIILILYGETQKNLCFNFDVEGFPMFHQKCAVSILVTLMCTAIGAGAVQANMAVFGAEQIQKSEITSRYFDKYVVAVNIGGVIAMLVIPYIGKNDFYIGSIVAAGILCFAAILFIIGCQYYIHIKPYDTVLTKCIPVLFNACQSWYRYKRNQRLVESERSISTQMSTMNVSIRTSRKEESVGIDERPSAFLDFAKLSNRGKFHNRIVNNVKSVSGALAIFIILIPYWVIYNQLEATFPLQGGQMRKPHGEFMIPLMSLGDPVTIIIGIFILNTFVYKHWNTENPVIILTTKFVIGMCFASITMCIAGVVEGFRQDQCDQKLNMNTSNLNIYYQLPQNIGMGLSELFTTVASYEFAYFAAPRSAQALFMSLCFCSSGISSFLSAIYINFFPKSYVDIDFKCFNNWQWSFYTYFFILAGIQLIFILILIICQNKFEIIKLNPEKMENHRFVYRSIP